MKIGLKAAEMISCEEAQVICNKKQYREASLIEKVELMLHILFCKACFKFSRKNNRLTRLVYRANLKTLSKAEKESMKRYLQKPGDS